MADLMATDREVGTIIRAENRRQHRKIRLIASENYVSKAVLEATGSILTNKYSEGYAGSRCYEGQREIDRMEKLCIKRVKALFGAEHVNVQPYSGSPANQAVMTALAKPGDCILGMSLAHGGHLTHGAPVSISGMLYRSHQYGVCLDTGLIDYEQVEKLAHEHQPRLIFCGHSAYPRIIDFEAFAAIGRSVKALVVADIAHFSGLVAAGLHPNPVPVVDVVTSTTHKTLRGPRGGMIMCRQEHASAIDRAVFPGLQGGPHNHVTAGLAVALKEADSESFRAYARQVLDNAVVLAAALTGRGFRLSSGGTENHLMLVDMSPRGISGKQMAKSLDAAGIVCNFNSVPFDPRPPLNPSGIRLGTPAVTTRGFREPEMEKIAAWIEQVAEIRADQNADKDQRRERYSEIAAAVRALCDRFPAPGLRYRNDGKPA